MFVLLLVISYPGYLKVKSIFENNNTISAQIVRITWF